MTSAYGAYHSRPPFGRAGTGSAMASSTRPRPSQMAVSRPDETDGTFRIGRVFRRAFGVLKPHGITFLALVALAAIPERVLYHLGGYGSKEMESFTRLALAAAGLLLQLAVMRLSFDVFAENRTSLAACAGQAVRSVLPAMAISLVAAIPVALTLFFLSLAWCVAIPARVSEDTHILASLRRSGALTRGHRWKILAVFLLLGFMLAPVFLALQALWGMPLSAHALFFDQNWLARLLFNASDQGLCPAQSCP